MTPEVEAAVKEIVDAYPKSSVDTVDDGQGGAFATLSDAPLSDLYAQDSTWVGFHITHTYPYADVYPHFVRADLARRDNKPLGDGTGMTNFRGRAAVQLSRRSNKLNPATDTALLKLQKVLRWLNSHP